jgi:hypothetical protein
MPRNAQRLAPMLAPLTPALAVIAFAAANVAAEAGGGNALSDIQVGEKGKHLRVALICEDDCRVGARSKGVYFIPDLRQSLSIDLTARSRNAQGLDFQPVAGGGELTIRAAAPIVAAAIKRCMIEAAPASCIDLEFAERQPRSAAAPPKIEEQAARGPPMLAVIEPISHAGPPPLRDAPAEEQLIFARFAPPERFAPPAAPTPQPQRAAAAPPPITPARAAQLLGEDFDLRAAAQEILGRGYSPADCAAAQSKLRADAWALDAMVDIGFCDAIDGRLAEADGVFARLLAYTPDNYEALVGRALVAAKTGDRDSAAGYFQDALNALPPIAESNRIVRAMAEL